VVSEPSGHRIGPIGQLSRGYTIARGSQSKGWTQVEDRFGIGNSHNEGEVQRTRGFTLDQPPIGSTGDTGELEPCTD
jgi:hypothetical protein